MFNCCGSSSSTNLSEDLVSVGDSESISVKMSHSHHNHHHHSSRCFTSGFMSRTGSRTIKSLCFLTAILAFCIGIGIGVLIPLNFNFLPKDLSLIQSQQISQKISQNSQLPVSQNNVDGLVLSDPILSKSEQNLYIPPDSVSVSQRFPEFAQIEQLNDGLKPVQNKNTTTNPYPMFRRPNVQFVPSQISRILSLHHNNLDQDHELQINLSSPPEEEEKNESKIHQKSAKKSTTSAVAEILDGIYWGEKIESSLPKGFSPQDVEKWRKFSNSSKVQKIEEGCGRMQNRLLLLENGTRACCRYRQNFDQIQGEIFSFYLGQVLQLVNLAPSSLGLVQPASVKWSSVRQGLNLAQWAEEKPVVLTKFIQNLQPAYIPQNFRDSTRRLHPIDIIISDKSQDFIQLAQWSDLIVFDYLTANLDRMVNNLYNLQWNPQMMEAPAHNLAREEKTGLLVFLDNESGLLHGYRLLDKYEQYHRIMLDSLCVFRKKTADVIKRLHRDKNVGNLLRNMFTNFEPNILDYLPMIPDKSIKILNHRIDRVYEQIVKCESLYMSSS